MMAKDDQRDSSSDSGLLDELCARLGVVSAFQDISGQDHTLSHEDKERVLSLLGVPTDSTGALEDWNRREQEGPLPPLVLPAVAVRVPIPGGQPGQTCAWTIEIHSEYEDIPGLARHGQQEPGARSGQATIEGAESGPVVRLPPSRPGYYRVTLMPSGSHNSSNAYERTLILTPPRAAPFPFSRRWGVSAQLYGLSSARNAGPGDFGEALRLGRELGALGMSVLGLSPIHALFPGNPRHASPYSPSSRLFWNLAYAPEGTPPRGSAAPTRIDYATEIPKRISMLRKAYERMKAQSIGLGYGRMHVDGVPLEHAFANFRTRFGEALRLHATYDTLYAHFAERGKFGSSTWPEQYRQPNSQAVQLFAREHADEISFYAFAQFLTHNGLQALVQGLHERDVQLYLDLAVGVDPSGAEAWSRPDLFCAGVSIGAPPDPFAPQGQDWGLAPFAPAALQQDGYRHFIRLLRATMPAGGMIRMDHAMQLHRLYWQVHDGGPPLGAYVSYPREDLLGILALESWRAQTAVIAEDLGTVPAGFREELSGRGMYTWKVLYFEKDGESFRDPATYPAGTLATVNTHDLPTSRAWWLAQDLTLRRELGLSTGPDTEKAKQERAREKEMLKETLANAGIAPDETDLESVVAALHELLARAPSELVLVALSDLLGETAAHNVPGTADRPENWALLYSLPVEKISDSTQARAIIKALRARNKP